MPRNKKFRHIIALAVIALFSCNSDLDPTSELGRKAIMDEVRVALSRGDCAQALVTLEPLADSENTDNEVRMLMASVYGCHASINFFDKVFQLGERAAMLAGPTLWNVATELFPSQLISDRVVEAAALGQQMLFSVITPGTVTLPQYLINTDGFNPGSLLRGDRELRANFYLMLMSMAAMGGSQYRYGAPETTFFNKTVALPWTTAAAVDTDGCLYASGVINFFDSLPYAAQAVSASLASSLNSTITIFQAALDQACDVGCQNLVPPWGGSQSGCTTTTACAACPILLRNPTACLGLASDQVSCAAAGIVNFINNSPLGWAGP